VWIHGVFSTKNRRQFITKDIEAKLYSHIVTYLQEKFNSPVEAINGTEDHVHVLFLMNASSSVAEIFKGIKGESAHWINEQSLGIHEGACIFNSYAKKEFIMKRYILLTIVLCLTGSLFAQLRPHYELSWEKEGILGGVGIVTAVTGMSLSAGIKTPTLADINALNRNDINRFDRGATNHWSESVANASDALAITLMVVPVSLMFSDKMSRDFQTLSFMYGETLWFSYFTASIAKGAVQRVRPYAYNPKAPLDKKLSTYTKESFFSSHTVGAFASMSFFAAVYNEYYPDSKYTPWIIAGGLAAGTAVGIMRIEAGHHFPTDVITGAAIGTAFGYIIPAMHKGNKSFNVVPTVFNNLPAVSLSAAL
jgi:membrane-associated phospholipid phosphatase/REP element-mobilizing transposase RayT